MCASVFYLANTHSRVQVRDQDGGSECRIAHSHSVRERTKTGWVSCVFLYNVAMEKSWHRSFCTYFTGNYTTWEKQRLSPFKNQHKVCWATMCRQYSFCGPQQSLNRFSSRTLLQGLNTSLPKDITSFDDGAHSLTTHDQVCIALSDCCVCTDLNSNPIGVCQNEFVVFFCTLMLWKKKKKNWRGFCLYFTQNFTIWYLWRPEVNQRPGYPLLDFWHISKKSPPKTKMLVKKFVMMFLHH